MARRHFLALLVALAFYPCTLFAQSATPEATALAYFAALSANKLDAMSGMMHPEALAGFRSTLLPVIELADKRDGGASDVLQMFDGVTTVAQLRKLDDVKFFTAFYAGLTTLQPQIVEMLRDAEIEALGHVMEGSDVAHVVYRMTLNTGMSITRTEVISMRRRPGGWGVLLTGEVEQMAEGLRQALEEQQ